MGGLKKRSRLLYLYYTMKAWLTQEIRGLQQIRQKLIN